MAGYKLSLHIPLRPFDPWTLMYLRRCSQNCSPECFSRWPAPACHGHCHAECILAKSDQTPAHVETDGPEPCQPGWRPSFGSTNLHPARNPNLPGHIHGSVSGSEGSSASLARSVERRSLTSSNHEPGPVRLLALRRQLNWQMLIYCYILAFSARR